MTTTVRMAAVINLVQWRSKLLGTAKCRNSSELERGKVVRAFNEFLSVLHMGLGSCERMRLLPRSRNR